ncbi:zeta toxin family protein [uncultured Campylobacter sp.]|uniref:zeta toxin family protein n=1 Tax=uncultured Campylobacter sp. TaxID=218934 RepID=UPI0026335944|nr:zeta toxin family protein [uncultured Campylobacter sp.]
MTDIEKLSQFSEQDINRVVNKFWKEVASSLESVERPQLDIVGGQPGAGKSDTIKNLKNDFNKNCLFLNYDNFRKDHPNASAIYTLDDKDEGLYSHFTNKFMKQVGDKVLKRAFEAGYNVILEKTLKSDKVKEYIDLALKKGYEVNLYVVTCDRDLSMSAVEYRFRTERNQYDRNPKKNPPPRKIPREFSDLCCEKLGDTVQKLSDTYGDKIKNLRIICRDKFFEQDVVFDKSLGHDTTKIKETIDCILVGKRRKLSDMEKAQISVMKKISKIHPFKASPGKEKEIDREKIDDGRSFGD